MEGFQVTEIGEKIYCILDAGNSSFYVVEGEEKAAVIDTGITAGAKILPLRSNIPAISRFCFAVCDESFPERAEKMGKSVIIGGSNYGQGSSREHAALAPLYLGVKAVIVKSFARIHMANLINAGILPLTFENEADYDRIDADDEIVIKSVKEQIYSGGVIKAENVTKGFEFGVVLTASDRQKDMLAAGGLLNYTKNSGK